MKAISIKTEQSHQLTALTRFFFKFSSIGFPLSKSVNLQIVYIFDVFLICFRSFSLWPDDMNRIAEETRAVQIKLRFMSDIYTGIYRGKGDIKCKYTWTCWSDLIYFYSISRVNRQKARSKPSCDEGWELSDSECVIELVVSFLTLSTGRYVDTTETRKFMSFRLA